MARGGVQTVVLFSNDFNMALTIFYFNNPSISFVPSTIVCYSCWIFPKSQSFLFEVVCSYIFSFTNINFDKASAYLMVKKFQQKCYMDESLSYESDKVSSSSSDEESDSMSFVWNGPEENFLSDMNKPSFRDLSSIYDCNDCLTL